MKLGVIGCGKMGSALIEGAIRSGSLTPTQITAFDPHQATLDTFIHTTGATPVTSIADLQADSYLLCTKPQHASAALAELPTTDFLLISVAAGLTTTWLEAHLHAGARVIRCMPNTPALIGEGAAAYCLGHSATPSDASTAESLLSAVGLSLQVPETLMDAVTGLSGSGPAFVYLMIEALSDGGVHAGLPRADATRLAAQTVLGAAAMVLRTGLHPGQLKDMVTSPAGTTIAGIAALERAGTRSAFIEAVSAASKRAAELGQR